MRSYTRTALIASVTALLMLQGCPDGDNGGTDQGPPDLPAVHEGPPSDRGPGERPATDGPGPVTIGFVAPLPDTDLPIGQHRLLKVKVSPAGARGQVKLAAPPCLLKLAGTGGPEREIAFPLDAAADLVVFAPPDAAPGKTCTVGAKSGAQVQPLAFDVQPPTYAVVNLDHPITMIEGLSVRTLGALENKRQVRSVTHAGGAFGGDWVVLTGENGDTVVEPSTVSFFRFGSSAKGPFAPWLDLYGKSQNPTGVEDMVWSPIGPCPLSPDALYVGGAGSDAPDPTVSGDDKGGMYCVDASKQRTTIHDDSVRTLDIDPVGTFDPLGSVGTAYYSRWGGHHIFPGGQSFKDPAFPVAVNRFRFARAGPHKGHLHVIGTTPHPLSRVSPAPHKATVFGDQNDPIALTFSHGGAFGELLVAPVRSPTTYGFFDVAAFFHEGGGVRTLELVRFARCGRHVAFDAAGQELLLVTSAYESCHGTATAYLLEFKLP